MGQHVTLLWIFQVSRNCVLSHFHNLKKIFFNKQKGSYKTMDTGIQEDGEEKSHKTLKSLDLSFLYGKMEVTECNIWEAEK